jgi:hypothetical protein
MMNLLRYEINSYSLFMVLSWYLPRRNEKITERSRHETEAGAVHYTSMVGTSHIKFTEEMPDFKSQATHSYAQITKHCLVSGPWTT